MPSFYENFSRCLQSFLIAFRNVTMFLNRIHSITEQELFPSQIHQGGKILLAALIYKSNFPSLLPHIETFLISVLNFNPFITFFWSFRCTVKCLKWHERKREMSWLYDSISLCYYREDQYLFLHQCLILHACVRYSALRKFLQWPFWKNSFSLS